MSIQNYVFEAEKKQTARILVRAMHRMGMKKKTEQKILTDSFSKNPAKIPHSVKRQVAILSSAFMGKTSWTFFSKTEKIEPQRASNNLYGILGSSEEPAKNCEESVLSGSKTASGDRNAWPAVVLYLHGGAYLECITRLHWLLCAELAQRARVPVVIADYPLAPEASPNDALNYVKGLYRELCRTYPDARHVLMGDSAGGGLALSLAQHLCSPEALSNEVAKGALIPSTMVQADRLCTGVPDTLDNEPAMEQPDELILFSPWLDVSMTDPMLEALDPQDAILSVKGLKRAAEYYTKGTDLEKLKQPPQSPLYGNFHGLCRTSVFTGTSDLLYADALRLKERFSSTSAELLCFEYPGMFHDWVLITMLPEARDALSKATLLVLGNPVI